MSERVLDARLHGHGGVEDCDRDKFNKLALEWLETPNANRLNIAERIYELGRQSVLASNPSPEPEDAEVEAAIEHIERMYWHSYSTPEMRKSWSIVKQAALRSQAGQGRVTVEMLREAIEYDGEFVEFSNTVDNLNDFLRSDAAQEPAK